MSILRDKKEGRDVLPTSGLSDRELEIIAALRKIRFGALEVVIHDGKVVQIERKEKTRLAR